MNDIYLYFEIKSSTEKHFRKYIINYLKSFRFS